MPAAFGAQPDFDARILRSLAARPFFRLVTDEEARAAFDAYRAGDWPSLCDVWQNVADPVRASLPGLVGRAYAHAGWAPARASGMAFLASVRAVLEAGRVFRARLRPEVRHALASEFPWLERRHEHIPPGWTPPFAFPDELGAFIEGGTLDDARARWQLVAALNEVQQAHYSTHAAARFRVPELAAHAARERALAVNYLSHWAPECDAALFRQCLIVLDGLNAAVFALLCREAPATMVARSLYSAVAARAEWRAFQEGLLRPQELLSPSAASRARR
jgi:hypothetical protein